MNPAKGTVLLAHLLPDSGMDLDELGHTTCRCGFSRTLAGWSPPYNSSGWSPI